MTADQKDHVTIELQNPRGWIYVDETENGWGWEARLGGWGLDAGIEPTKEEALAAARATVARELSR